MTVVPHLMRLPCGWRSSVRRCAGFLLYQVTHVRKSARRCDAPLRRTCRKGHVSFTTASLKAEFQGTSLAVGSWNEELQAQLEAASCTPSISKRFGSAGVIQQELRVSDAYGNIFALRVASTEAAGAMSVGVRPGTDTCQASSLLSCC